MYPFFFFIRWILLKKLVLNVWITSSSNEVDDAFSQRYGLLAIIYCEIIDFDVLLECHTMDNFLSKVLNDVSNGKSQRNLMLNDFLFRENWLCQPEGSLGLFVELHASRFCGYFDQGRIETLVKKRYYFRAYLNSDIFRFLQKFLAYQMAKGGVQSAALFSKVVHLNGVLEFLISDNDGNFFFFWCLENTLEALKRLIAIL